MPFTAGRPIAEAKAELFKALAHPARVRVLELLAEGEHTMGELAEQTGLEPVAPVAARDGAAPGRHRRQPPGQDERDLRACGTRRRPSCSRWPAGC